MKKIKINKAISVFVYSFIFGCYFCSTAALANNTSLFSKFQQQTLQVSGTITDANGTLPGVSITVKGKPSGTVSGLNGKYTIEVASKDILVFSFLGYKTMIIPVEGRSHINVQLQEDLTALQEVQINAGYYTVKDSERTGNISKISSSSIEKQPVSNALAAMQGRMAGVYITQTTGVPGGSFDVQIRGQNSIASGNAPLYIVNGVPLNKNVSSSIGNLIVRGGNPLNGIDLSDVESIEVLKDADATAIYGSRGANGVVLITTKKGFVGSTRFDVDVQSGISTVANKMDLLNSEQYIMMREEAFANDGVAPTTANARDLLLWDTNRYTDWQEKLIGGSAILTNVQASVSGGSELTSFRLGGGLRKETTVYPGDFKYQKASGHIQLNHVSKDKRFSMTFSGNYVSEVNKLFSQDLTSLILLPPVAPEVYNNEGSLNWGPVGGSFNNPYSVIEKDYKVRTNNLVSNTNVSYEPIKGLIAKVGVGYTTTQVEEIQTTPTNAINPSLLAFLKAESYFNHNSLRSWLLEPQLEYRQDFGESSLNILFGSTFQQQITEGQSTYATDFSSDLLLEDVGAAGTTRSNSLFTDYKYQAIFGRINYNYKSKYLVNLTGRRDGSSRFGPGKQFANFGAVGVAWIFSNENFVSQSIPFLSFGKLRGSYGTTGNDQIGDYRYLDSYSSTLYPYQNILGLHPTRLFNPLYGWETNKKLEAALEFGLFKDRLRLSTTWYANRSSNQLVGYPLPGTTGFSSIQSNLAAKIENTGFEFELHTVNVSTDSFRWMTNANLTFSKNELLEYPELESSSYAQQYEVGKSLSLIRSFHALGVNPQTGVYEFEDVNGDGVINYPNDLQSLVELDPEFYGGIGNALSYKGLKLDVFVQFVKQKGYHPLYLLGSAPGRMGNQLIQVLDRWQHPGDVATVQQFTQRTASEAYTAFNNSLFYGDNRFTDASFVRLKTVSLTYQIPKGILGNLTSEVYLQGQNLLTITAYDGLDPETNSSLRLPPLRMITVGIRLTF